MKFLRYAELEPKDAPDEAVRGPLWHWAPWQIKAVKHERRRRFQFDTDAYDDVVETEYS